MKGQADERDSRRTQTVVDGHKDVVGQARGLERVEEIYTSRVSREDVPRDDDALATAVWAKVLESGRAVVGHHHATFVEDARAPQLVHK